MSDTPKKFRLKKVSITRIGVCGQPAVPAATFVLMKSVSGEPTTPKQETDMDLTKLTLDDLRKNRPDLVTEIEKAVKPPALEGSFVDEDTFNDAIETITQSMEALEKSVRESGEKIAKNDGGAAKLADLEKSVGQQQAAIAKLTTDLDTLAKAKSQQLKDDPDAGKDVKKNRGAFDGVFRTVSAAQQPKE